MFRINIAYAGLGWILSSEGVASSLHLLLSWAGETEVLGDHLEVCFFPRFRLNLLGVKEALEMALSWGA